MELLEKLCSLTLVMLTGLENSENFINNSLSFIKIGRFPLNTAIDLVPLHPREAQAGQSDQEVEAPNLWLEKSSPSPSRSSVALQFI